MTPLGGGGEGGGRGRQKFGNGWSTSIVVENKVVLTLIIGMGPNNQVNQATRSGVIRSFFSVKKENERVH